MQNMYTHTYIYICVYSRYLQYIHVGKSTGDILARTTTRAGGSGVLVHWCATGPCVRGGCDGNGWCRVVYVGWAEGNRQVGANSSNNYSNYGLLAMILSMIMIL